MSPELVATLRALDRIAKLEVDNVALRERADQAEARERELRAALEPFAALAGTWTVQTASMRDEMLTLSNGERMCAIDPADIRRAARAVEGEGR